jgi:hypothetical protein
VTEGHYYLSLSLGSKCQFKEFELDLLMCIFCKGIKSVRMTFLSFWYCGNCYQCFRNIL